MSIKNYIVASDLTSTVADDFNVSGYVSRANDHAEYVAQSVGVLPSGMVYPVRFIFKEYLMDWAYRAMYQDKIGVNNNEILDGDKYMVLHDLYNKEVERLRRYLTYETVGVSGTLSSSETARITTVFRG